MSFEYNLMPMVLLGVGVCLLLVGIRKIRNTANPDVKKSARNGFVIPAVTLVVIANIIIYVDDNKAARANDLDKSIALIVQGVNQNAPVTIDGQMRAEKATVEKKTNVVFNYTLLAEKIADNEIAALKRDVQPKMKAAIVEKTRADKSARNLFGRGVVFVFRYRDLSGNIIDEFSVSSADFPR